MQAEKKQNIPSQSLPRARVVKLDPAPGLAGTAQAPGPGPLSSAFPAPALEIHDIFFRYRKRDILNGLSLRAEQGQVCGLLGPNGSGKTTLFKCCLNFLKPQSGQILLNGVESPGLRAPALARLVSYVPQDSRLSFPFTVREVVRMGRTPHLNGLMRLSRRDISLADEALEKVGIGHLADKPCTRLSGGQRQLVLIARAVAQNAPIMLLDEPTSALDFQNQLEVWKTLRQVAAHGVSVVVCSHDPNHILWYCDKAVVISEGRTLASGPPAEVLVPEVLEKIYGGICTQGMLDGRPIIYPVR